MDHLKKLLKQLERTQQEELTCDECFELLDEFAQLAHEDRAPGELMPLVEQHLELCRDCREEYEALIATLEGMESH